MSDVILSICIPTYNRGIVLYENIKTWLQADNQKFEIIVSDNCSSDNTLELLKSINDNRLIIIENEQNYGGYINGKIALSAGSGKYLMQMTDKDNIDISNIDKAINFLENLNVPVGRFLPDCSNKESEIVFISDKIKKLSRFCFCGNHPSGFFFNRKLFHEKNIFDLCLNYDEGLRSYLTDFLTTLLCDSGDVAIIHLPFVCLVKPPFKNIKHSHTYTSKKGNLFFLPENRFRILGIYLDFLNEIEVSKFERLHLIKCLIRNLYYFCTSDYLTVLNNKEICEWYGLSQEFIEKEKCKSLDKLFLLNLLHFKNYANIFERIYALTSFVIWYSFKKNKHIRRKV